MARPAFDYDPNSEEALAAAVGSTTQPEDISTVPSANYDPDYGAATVPTQEDLASAESQRLRAEVERFEREQDQRETQAIMQSTPAGQNATAARGAHQNAVAFANAADATVQVPSRPNPIAPIVQEHGATRMDLAGQQVGAAMQTSVEAANKQAREAQYYEQEAARQQAANDAQQAALIRAAARREQAMESERTIVKAVQNATDKLARTPDDDRGRYWSNLKWYNKLGWSISALARGLRGLEPMAALDAAIEGDLSDQRAAREARRGEVQGQLQQLDAHRAIFSDLRNSIGDDEIAADALRIARYQQAQTLLMAELLRNGIPLEMAKQHEGILELQQKANDLIELTRAKIAVTPERVGGGTRYVNSPERRRFLYGEAKAEAAHGRALEAGGIEQGYKAEAERRAGDVEVAKETAKAKATAAEQAQQEKRGAHGIYAEAQSFAKEYGPQLAVIGQIDGLKQAFPGNNIPGISRMSLGGEYEGQVADVIMGDEAGASAKVHNALNQIEEELGRARSQGAITSDEEERFKSQLRSGLQFGGAARLHQNLDAIRYAMMTRVEPGERALSPEAREYVLRNKLVPSFSALYGTAGASSADPALEREDR